MLATTTASPWSATENPGPALLLGCALGAFAFFSFFSLTFLAFLPFLSGSGSAPRSASRCCCCCCSSSFCSTSCSSFSSTFLRSRRSCSPSPRPILVAEEGLFAAEKG